MGSAEAVAELRVRFAEPGVDHYEVKATKSGTAVITPRDPDNLQVEVFGGRLAADRSDS